MTTVTFLLREGEIVGYTVSGHTGAAAAGSDILCAAISSAAYMAANTITDVLGVAAKVAVSDGKLSLLVPEEQEDKCRATLKGFMLHMKQLRKQNPKRIRIINVTTGKEHYYA